jgi:hypothetical protein
MNCATSQSGKLDVSAARLIEPEIETSRAEVAAVRARLRRVQRSIASRLMMSVTPSLTRASHFLSQPRPALKVGPGTCRIGGHPMRTVSMEIEPPSNPETGKLMGSPSLCSAMT